MSKCELEIRKGVYTPPIWFVDYFYRLILPFSRICTKQVVDIVAFLFTRTTVGEFDELFEIFGNKTDFLVELNLLKVKLIRERSNKYRCKKCKLIDKYMCGKSRSFASNECSIEESIKNMNIKGSGDDKEENKLSISEVSSDDLEDAVCKNINDHEKGMDFYSIENNNKDKKERLIKMEKISADQLSYSQDKPFYPDTTVISSTLINSDVSSTNDTLIGCDNNKNLSKSKCSDPVAEMNISEEEINSKASVLNDTSPDSILDEMKYSIKENMLDSTKEESEKLYKDLFSTPSPCMCNPKNPILTPMICLCGAYNPSEEEQCLSKAKKCLLDLESISPKFFLENTALYLSLSFDKELFLLFKKYMTTEYKGICASNLFRLKEVNMEDVENMIDEIKEAKGDILKADGLIITPNTLKLYADWCIETFDSISVSSISNYAEISRLYIKFLRIFQNEEMFSILRGICTCKIERAANIVRNHLVKNLEEIVEILMKLPKKADMENNINGEDMDKQEIIIGGDNNTIIDKPYMWNLDTTEIEVIFNDLRSFSIPISRMKQELEMIIIEIYKNHRRGFLSQLGVLEYFSDEFKSKAIDSLCANCGIDWRYKRELLHSYKKYPLLFKNKNILDTLIKDPVFIVRRTALDIKEGEDNCTA